MRNHRTITMGVAFAIVLAMLVCGCQKPPRPGQGQSQTQTQNQGQGQGQGQGQEQEQGQGQGQDPPSGGEEPDEITLTLSTASVFMATEGGKQSIVINTNANQWTAQSDQEWCHVEKDKMMINLVIDANPWDKVRTASVTVTAGGKVERTVTVVQSAGKAGCYIFPTRAIVTVPSSGTYGMYLPSSNEMVVRVQTNLKGWTCSSDESWCVVRCDDGNVYFSVNPYYSTRQRTAVITLTHEEMEYSQITVTQKPWTSLQVAFPDGNSLPVDGGSIRVKIYTNASEWTARTASENCWFSLEVADSETLVISAPKRTGSTPRTGEEVIVSTEKNTETFVIYEAQSYNEGYGYDDGVTDWDD